MNYRRWLFGGAIFVLLLGLLGFGHGITAAIYSFFYGIQLPLVAKYITGMFKSEPVLLLLGMCLIARGWYGMRIVFKWSNFITGIFVSFLLLIGSFLLFKDVIAQLGAEFNQIVTHKIGFSSHLLHTFVLSQLLWTLYIALLIIAYSFLLSSLYILPGKGVVSGYLNFLKVNFWRLLIASFIFGFLHHIFVLFSLAFRLELLSKFITDTLFSTNLFGSYSYNVYLGEMLTEIILVGAMLWVVVAWFVRMQRRVIQPAQ